MSTGANSLSGYDHRVQLAVDALMRNSSLTRETALTLAKHVLYAVDHIPERVR